MEDGSPVSLQARPKNKKVKKEIKYMPKMKSKKALTKRIKVTGSGKVCRHHAYVSHLAPHKTHKQKRHLRKETSVSKSDMKRIKYLIQQ